MSNPESQAVVSGFVHELYEFFERPDYFHIGKISSKEFRLCRNCAAKSADELLSLQIGMLYMSFGEDRPRFVLGKEKSSEKKKVKVSFPGDILLELNDGEKVIDGIDCVQNISSEDAVLAEDAGGTIFDLDAQISEDAAADIAWNGRKQQEYSADALVQVKLNVIADMEPVTPFDY